MMKHLKFWDNDTDADKEENGMMDLMNNDRKTEDKGRQENKRCEEDDDSKEVAGKKNMNDVKKTDENK